MRVLTASLALVFFAGCSNTNLDDPGTPDTQLFAPSAMRVHRIFTQVKDWTGDNKPDGIEVLVEFLDQFGDSTKAAGTFRFELYDYRPGDPEPRGFRLVNPWQGSIATAREQRTRWNRVSHTYSFQLADPQIRKDRSYVLTAQFDSLSGGRFFDRIILPAQEAPSATTKPTSRPGRGLLGM